uniref:Uncharacterized protein n=1 Tax=Triticum urartu TaxID=4572 RepID=A0A8R7USS7_TRIUA
MANLENSELGAITECGGNITTQSVVTEVKQSQRWRPQANSGSGPLSWLKLTSRTMMLPEDMSSGGRTPEKELYERLTRCRLVMPSHSQQSVPLSRHNVARPPSCDSPARKPRRLRFSCSVHAVAGEAKMRSTNSCSTTGGMMEKCIGCCFFPLFCCCWQNACTAGTIYHLTVAI